jgi:hypothetical protein
MMTGRRLALLAVVLAAGLAGACGSSSGGSVGPNKAPGQCVLSDDVWYCGAGYGNFPDCAVTSGPCTPEPDAGACFSCALDGVAGVACGCDAAQDGGPSWQCLPTETGCGK